MKLKERFIAHVHAQFGRPNGFWGSIAGWIMAVRSSNRKRNVWAVSLLDVQHGDRILEIGFGPGLAIREISRIALDGYVCGLDHSARMLRQATRRNATAIRHGRVDLRLGSVESLPASKRPSIRSWPLTPSCSGTILRRGSLSCVNCCDPKVA
jgi:SAM-dependent methyltransferase